MQLMIVTLATVMSLAATGTALAQNEVARDCQRDFACFAAAAATCSRARVVLQVPLPLDGTELDSTRSYEILGNEGEYCLLRSRVERIATRLTGGAVVREQLEQQRRVIGAITSGIEWLDVTCRFAADDLTVMLDRWVTVPVIANADLNRVECTGGPVVR
jgi:hypothetical protein